MKSKDNNKLFIPYYEAIEVVKLGFDEEVLAFYGQYGANPSLLTILGVDNEIYSRKTYKAPLWQQAFDWFRDERNLLSFIDIDYNNNYYYSITDTVKEEVLIIKEYKTYDEAKLACLRNLIELCEGK